MTTKQENERHAEIEDQQREHRRAVIARQVLALLGRPGDLYRVEVRPLWERRYRVNVLTGGSSASAAIAHSYFLETDADGKIVTATPEITRRY